MGELEASAPSTASRDGRGVPLLRATRTLGTHLTGAVRDKAQAEAPKLRLVEPA